MRREIKGSFIGENRYYTYVFDGGDYEAVGIEIFAYDLFQPYNDYRSHASLFNCINRTWFGSIPILFMNIQIRSKSYSV